MRTLFACLSAFALIGAFVVPTWAAETADAKPTTPRTNTITSPGVTVTGMVKELKLPEAGKPGNVRCSLATDADAIPVSFAPAKFFEKIGLVLKEGEKITVKGWQLGDKPTAFIVAGTVTAADGKVYTFRDAKGQQVWNDVEFLTAVALTGTVKDLVLPAETATPPAGTEAKPTPAAGDKPATTERPRRPSAVTFTLVTEKESYLITVGQAKEVEKLGLPLKEGDTVTVNGWLMPRGKVMRVLVRDLTVAGKAYTVRDAAGKVISSESKPRGGGKDEKR